MYSADFCDALAALAYEDLALKWNTIHKFFVLIDQVTNLTANFSLFLESEKNSTVKIFEALDQCEESKQGEKCHEFCKLLPINQFFICLQ